MISQPKRQNQQAQSDVGICYNTVDFLSCVFQGPWFGLLSVTLTGFPFIYRTFSKNCEI